MSARVWCALLLLAASGGVAAAPPNILLLFPDQWRYDWDGFHTLNTGDLPLKTPTMHKLAEEGTRFTQAYVPSPLCAPSRSCLAAGREYDAAGVLDNFANDYPINQTTFYSLLRDAGYHTMTTGKDDLTKATQLGSKVGYAGCSYCRAGDGLYHQHELGFADGLRYSGKLDVVNLPDPHEMYGYWLRNHTVPYKGANITAWEAHRACMGRADKAECTKDTYTDTLYEDDFTAENALTLLRRKPKGKPWMLHVSFPGPHNPFLVTGRMHDSVAGRVWPPATDNGKVSPQVCNVTGEPDGTPSRCNYAAEVENLDRLFEKVIDEVERLGELEQTIVCATSDHGEMLDDHGDTGKSKPWQGSASVPLVCRGPGIAKQQTVTRPVGTVDLAATFLDFAGVAKAPGMTAVSMRGLLDGTASSGYRDTIQSGLGNWRMVVKQLPASTANSTLVSYKYICCKGECPGAPSTAPKPSSGWTQMLIDVEADPFDMHDLAPEKPEVVNALRPLLPADYAKGCGQQ